MRDENGRNVRREGREVGERERKRRRKDLEIRE